MAVSARTLPAFLHPEYVPWLMHHFTKFSSDSSSPDLVPTAWWASDGVTLKGAACSFWHLVHAVIWASYVVMEAVLFCLLFLHLKLHCWVLGPLFTDMRLLCSFWYWIHAADVVTMLCYRLASYIYMHFQSCPGFEGALTYYGC